MEKRNVGQRGTVGKLEEVEKNHILEVLKKTGWKVSGDKGAAKILGLNPTTLEARMKKLGIKREGGN
jgi:transcriptional regulator with GAF, ATPase, and Fis domain